MSNAFTKRSEVYPVETCGALGKGGEIFAALNAGTYDFMGEEYSGFFTLYENKLAKGKVKLFYTPVRVVCQNTLMLAMDDGQKAYRVRHSKKMQFKLEEN